MTREKKKRSKRRTGKKGRARLALNDFVDWPRLYPGLRRIELVHLCGFNPDPLLVLKADSDPGNDTFLVAGYSTNEFNQEERFYGLMLYHEEKEMAWLEIHEPELQWEGPGWCRYVVDEAWQPRRFSEVAEQYSAYGFVPEEGQRRHPRYPLVTARDLGELKGWLEKAQDIPTVALVGDFFDVARARCLLAMVPLGMGQYDGRVRESRALELAAHGLLRLAVKDLASVPEEWRPYALPLGDLPYSQRCEVTYAGSMYYVGLIGKILPPSRPEDLRSERVSVEPCDSLAPAVLSDDDLPF
jgi:hypothetical protein